MTSFADFGSTFLLLGPPAMLLVGTSVTVIAAAHSTGRRRWSALAMGPLLTFASTLASTWFVITVLRPGEGSGFLLGLSAIFLYALLMIPFYLVLAGLGLRAKFRGHRAQEGWDG